MSRLVGFPSVGLTSEPAPKVQAQTGKLQTSSDGSTSSIGQSPGFFRGTIGVALSNDDEFMDWTDFITALGGMRNIFAFNFYHVNRNPNGIRLGRTYGWNTENFSDDTTFTDGTSFLETYTDVTSPNALSAGATTATFYVTNDAPIQRGMFFSQFAFHHITRAKKRGTGVYDVEFLPPLARDVPPGRKFNFDNPIMYAHLTGPDQGRLENDFAHFATVSIGYMEAAPSTIAQTLGLTL